MFSLFLENTDFKKRKCFFLFFGFWFLNSITSYLLSDMLLKFFFFFFLMIFFSLTSTAVFVDVQVQHVGSSGIQRLWCGTH